MPGPKDRYFDSLRQEAVKEMADNFFAPRAEVDKELEHFSIRARMVRDKGAIALLRAARLHALLLTGRAAPDFYRAVGVDPGRLVELADVSLALVRPEPIRVDLSRRGYAKMVVGAYEAARDALDEYLNGRLYPDPEHYGRKVQSMHYRRLVSWCEEINAAIDELNQSHQASSVLTYFKGMDPVGAAREKAAGGGVDNFAQSVDESLRIPRCAIDPKELPDLPELPATDSIEDAAYDFAKDLFDRFEDELIRIVGRLGGIEND